MPRRRPGRFASKHQHLIGTVFLLCTTLCLHAQNTLDKAGLGAGVNASAAYAMRLLSSSYAGKALKVRRSSDNSTQDIGFTAGGELDSVSLKTFVGAGSGYVITWYDQSGNGLNLTQATAINQPVLVNAGTINRENTRPFIRFWGVPGVTFNSLALASQMTTVGHVSAVMKFAAGGYGFILSHSGAYNWHSNPATALVYSIATTSVQNGGGWSNASAQTPTAISWPTTLTLEELEPATPSSGTNWDNIGNDRSCCHEISGGGGYGELILFNTALSVANRQLLENNHTLYFGIGTLPVTWLAFTAHMNNGKTYLQWQTTAERNSKEFTVEYSTDGHSWAALATLPTAGNSSTIREYSYVHYAPQPGENFYRIAETDDDGRTDYSSIVAVTLPAIATRRPEFDILENPSSHARLSLRVNTPVALSVIGMDGKICWKGRLDPGVREIPMDGHPQGVYLVAGTTTTIQVLMR